MVDSNKIGSLTRTWPSQPIKKDHNDKNKQQDKKKDKDQDSKQDIHKDPGDTIIDEYV